jgi:predicted Rossmann fold flavoprotein
MYNSKVQELIVEGGEIKGVVTDKGKRILGEKVIVTTGGKSYPGSGSDGSMFEVLRSFHTITPLYAALIPLVIKEEFVKSLQGVAMKNVVISAKVKKRSIEKFGDMIFTHFGISGPAVLKLSSYINKALVEGEVEVTLDFLREKSKQEISEIMRINPNKTVLNNLKGILPQNFLKEIFDLLGLTETKISDLKKTDENKIIEYMKEMKLTARETLSIKAAQVTSGGVKVKEINASTMESKIIKNLYFAGEVIDIDAETGGYNLQMAFSTGYLAGKENL